MNRLGRTTLLLMIPLDLVLVVWVWIGRLVFGVYGWYALVLAPVALVLLVGLVVTTIMAFTQEGRPRSLTRFQALAQLATWLGMLVAGAFMPDFGDTDDSHISLLTQLFGRSDALLSLSYTIVLLAAVATLVAYIVLVVSLTAGRRERAATPVPAQPGPPGRGAHV